MSAEVLAFRSVCRQLIYVVAFKLDLAGDRNESKYKRDYYLARSSDKLFFNVYVSDSVSDSSTSSKSVSCDRNALAQ